MKKVIFMRLFVILGLVCTSGCYTRCNVTTGISGQLKEFYKIYPTVELDVIAVTKKQAEELSSNSIEAYFSPNSSLRKDLSPYTMTFSSEDTSPRTLESDAIIWDKWLENKPEQIAILVNLPRNSDPSKKNDPRMSLMELESSFLYPRTLYFEVKPASVVQIYKAPIDPQKPVKK